MSSTTGKVELGPGALASLAGRRIWSALQPRSSRVNHCLPGQGGVYMGYRLAPGSEIRDASDLMEDRDRLIDDAHRATPTGSTYVDRYRLTVMTSL